MDTIFFIESISVRDYERLRVKLLCQNVDNFVKPHPTKELANHGVAN